MADGFHDLTHVKGWLEQFESLDQSTKTEYASVQMIQLLALALKQVIAELEQVKAFAGTDRQ